MRRVPLRAVLVLFATVLAPGAARAGIDITGTWIATVQAFLGSTTAELDFVQTGSGLSLTYTIQGGSPQGPFAGTINSATGAFSVPLPDTFGPLPGLVCTGNGILGTAAPGPPAVLSGTWVSQFYKVTPPVGCFGGGGPFTTGPNAGCGCDPCEVCTPTGCEIPIDRGCQPALAGASSVTISDGETPAKDKLKWAWRSSGTVSVGDLGNPFATSDYTLCVIDQNGGVPTLRLSRTVPVDAPCASAACWTPIPSGYKYRNAATASDGLTTIVLRAGSDAGRGKLAVKGQGALLDVPPLGLTASVIVRLIRDDAPVCWEAIYSTSRANTASTFRARSD